MIKFLLVKPLTLQFLPIYPRKCLGSMFSVKNEFWNLERNILLAVMEVDKENN